MKQANLIRAALAITTALFISSCARKTHSDIQLAVSTSVSEIVTTRTADTLIHVPADTARGSRPLSDLTDDRPLVFETPTQRVTVRYDRQTGNIQAEAITTERQVPVRIQETTTQRNNESHVESSEVRRTETTPSPWISPWPWLLILLIIVIFGLWIKRTFRL